MSASGKRNPTDRFPAMNPKGGRSRRDPELPDGIFMGNGGLLIPNLPLN
jgi:hypothetical protein